MLLLRPAGLEYPAGLSVPPFLESRPMNPPTETEYQTQQETVHIVETPIRCPRCGSSKRTPLHEFDRRRTAHGLVIRYRTRCEGMISPCTIDGKPLLDENGNQKTYLCGNRYKVRKFIPDAPDQ